MHIKANTLDDLVREVVTRIRSEGILTKPRRGDALELTGVLLELSNPLARLSSTEDRGKIVSCLGELSWYLAKREDLAFMQYYIAKYDQFVKTTEGTVVGAYGPRLFGGHVSQFWNALETLKSRPYSRNAVLVILRADDLVADGFGEAPCTSTLQFFLRNERLDMVTTMRSNDAYKGLLHDAFSFTMMQEIAARSLSVNVGVYKHFVGSLHLYASDYAGADRFLSEGWQPTTSVMPAMPIGDPRASISLFLRAEEELRLAGTFDKNRYGKLDPYWLDLICLLRVFRAKKDGASEKIAQLRNEMGSKVYVPLIDGLINA